MVLFQDIEQYYFREIDCIDSVDISFQLNFQKSNLDLETNCLQKYVYSNPLYLDFSCLQQYFMFNLILLGLDMIQNLNFIITSLFLFIYFFDLQQMLLNRLMFVYTNQL